jgi:hypothetical protein
MLIILDFMHQIFNPVYSRKYIKHLVFIIGSAFWFCINLFEIPILNFSYCLISIFAIAVFLYNVKHLKEILQLIIFIISYAGCDIIASSLISIFIGYIPFYGSNSVLYLFNVLVAQTFIAITIKVLIVLLKKQSFTNKYRKKYLFLLILPILNIITVDIILILPTYKINQNFIYYIIVLMAIISAILNIVLIYSFENAAKSDQLENDLMLMKQHVDMQYNYYRQLEVEYNNSQKIMHDVKNHIRVLERLYTTNHYAEGLEYAKKIYDIVEQLGMKFKCDNRILNIIINEKMKICELNNIAFNYSAENINLDFISEIDITTIFANILDNAIEACQRIENGDRQIEFHLYRFNNMIIINLMNSVKVLPIKSGDEYISTKEGHKAIGLSNVKSCINKYDGDLDMNLEQGKFSVSIMLPINFKKSLS